MRFIHRFRATLALATIATILSMLAVDHADARRGGSFGSRGFRTFDKPAPTRTSPRENSPVERSMTPRPERGQSGAQRQGAADNRPAAARQGFGAAGGMMGGLLGGLMLGGLVGLLFGGGLGGVAGLLGLIVQVGLVVLVVALVMRFLRGRATPALAGAPTGGTDPSGPGMARTPFSTGAPSSGAAQSGRMDADAPSADAPSSGDNGIGLTADDFDAFEQLLEEVQAAFTREDYASLRDRCTPEIVSFLSEELSRNAVNGVRNDVVDVKLLQGDLSEAWREGDTEYATVAMRYESVDVMRDRETGAIVEGKSHPTETTELWTFTRPAGGAWKLSAIQEA